MFSICFGEGVFCVEAWTVKPFETFESLYTACNLDNNQIKQHATGKQGYDSTIIGLTQGYRQRKKPFYST